MGDTLIAASGSRIGFRPMLTHDQAMSARVIPRMTGWFRPALAWLVLAACAVALEIPAQPLTELASDDFRTRENAQAKILKWGREHVPQSMDLLFEHSFQADDPEVRERCLAVLRSLVDDEYQKDGEGFIGIRMLDEVAMIPGDPRRRSVIRVTMVMPDSPALKAGLKVNDLIAGIGDVVWHENSALMPFSEEVRKFKPGSEIKLSVLRDGKLVIVPVVLTRRPLMADNPFLGERQAELEAAEAAAREAYFRRWLERKKAAK